MSEPRTIWVWRYGTEPASIQRGDWSTLYTPETHLYHHDAVVRELVEAAQELLDEKDDYMRRNNLGDPMKETVSARVRAALAKIAQEGKP